MSAISTGLFFTLSDGSCLIVFKVIKLKYTTSFSAAMASMFSTQDFVEKITKITPGNTKPEQIKQVRGEKFMFPLE